MRNDLTDSLGYDMTQRYQTSGMNVSDFIKHMVKTESAFDTTETTLHIIIGDEIISFYFIADRNKWYAKY